MVSMLFRDPKARSSALAALGTLGTLSHVAKSTGGSVFERLIFARGLAWWAVIESWQQNPWNLHGELEQLPECPCMWGWALAYPDCYHGVCEAIYFLHPYPINVVPGVTKKKRGNSQIQEGGLNAAQSQITQEHSYTSSSIVTKLLLL